MRNFKYIGLLLGVIFYLKGYSQNDIIIKSGYVNFATLIVDYDTYSFEGGDLSYYSCPNCTMDSIPLTIDYDSPEDYGGVTFKLSSLPDTLFNATIIWMGNGEIYYPSEFTMQSPFIDTNLATIIPSDLKYIGMIGNEVSDADFLKKADSAWSSIDSLKVTRLFAENGFKSAIYLYAPSVGMFDPSVAKWIIFFYHYDQANLIKSHFKEETHIQMFPNPSKGVEKINLTLINTQISKYKIFNSSGQLVDSGGFLNNVYNLDVTQLNAGLYLLQLSNENNNVISTEKILIEKPSL